jgi:hypothetical protein
VNTGSAAALIVILLLLMVSFEIVSLLIVENSVTAVSGALMLISSALLAGCREAGVMVKEAELDAPIFGAFSCAFTSLS